MGIQHLPGKHASSRMHSKGDGEYLRLASCTQGSLCNLHRCASPAFREDPLCTGRR